MYMLQGLPVTQLTVKELAELALDPARWKTAL